MSNTQKLIEAKWWSLKIPDHWVVENIRGGKLVRPSQKEELKLICTRKDTDVVTEQNLFEFFGKTNLSDDLVVEQLNDLLILSDYNVLDPKNNTKWVIGIRSYLFIANLSSSLHPISPDLISKIDQLLKKIEFVG